MSEEPPRQAEIRACPWCERTSEEEVSSDGSDDWQETCGSWSGYEAIVICPQCYDRLMRELEV